MSQEYDRALSSLLAGRIDKRRDLHKLKMRLASDEYRLLEVRFLIRQRQFQDAENLLSMTSVQNPRLTPDLHFLKSNLHSYSGRHDQALRENLHALEKAEQHESHPMLFPILYNLNVDFQRLGQSQKARQYLAMAEAASRNARDKSLVHRARASLAMEAHQLPEALAEIQKAWELRASLNSSDSFDTEMILAEILALNDQMPEALKILRALSQAKLGRHHARVQLSWRILELLLHSRPIDLPRWIETTESTLQWNLLISLQCGDLEQASCLWSQLHKLNPQLYESDFRLARRTSSNSLLMSAIEHLRRRGLKEISIQGPPQIQKLVTSLQQAQFPIRKELLIEHLWGDYCTSFDSRFYKLIERARKLGIPVESNKRGYQLGR